MSLALSSVASSLRVFGRELIVFKRENSAGLMTEAYYIGPVRYDGTDSAGKCLAHMPTLLLAPLFFLVLLYQLTSPLASFFDYCEH
jgi:hypothetical protein